MKIMGILSFMGKLFVFTFVVSLLFTSCNYAWWTAEEARQYQTCVLPLIHSMKFNDYFVEENNQHKKEWLVAVKDLKSFYTSKAASYEDDLVDAVVLSLIVGEPMEEVVDYRKQLSRFNTLLKEYDKKGELVRTQLYDFVKSHGIELAALSIDSTEQSVRNKVMIPESSPLWKQEPFSEILNMSFYTHLSPDFEIIDALSPDYIEAIKNLIPYDINGSGISCTYNMILLKEARRAIERLNEVEPLYLKWVEETENSYVIGFSDRTAYMFTLAEPKCFVKETEWNQEEIEADFDISILDYQ